MAKPTDTQITSYFDQCQALIRDHGWMIQGVFPTGDGEHDDLAFPFAYTIGRAVRGEPELLMVGDYRVCAPILNAVAHRLDDAMIPALANGNVIGDRDRDWVGELRIRGPVDDAAGGTPVHMARNYYAWAGTADPDALVIYQVEWPDPQGRYLDTGAVDDGSVSPQLPLKGLIVP